MNRINDKLIEIEKFLEELESIFPIDFETYMKDWRIRDICERRFEKISEAAVDLTFLIIKEKGFEFPKDEESSFNVLLNHNIISKELSMKLRTAKGMRNIIAHKYGKVDDKIVFDAVTQKLIKDINEFINIIKDIK